MGGHTQEELVNRLSQFGLTTNQSKVYLSIIQAGSISAGTISKVTFLHRQDIYKILPKLEKKGLISKTIGKPTKIKAIPLETALYQMILSEKEKTSKKIAALESNVKDLIEALKDQPPTQEDAGFTLLTTDDLIKNRANLSIQGLKKEVKMAANPKLLLSLLNRLNEIIESVAEKSIRLSLLVAPFEDLETVKKTIEKLKPNQNKICTKGISNGTFTHYLIVDRREVWIATEQKTEAGFPCILWTNDRNVVQVYEENFYMGWNHPLAVMLFPKNVEKKKGTLILV